MLERKEAVPAPIVEVDQFFFACRQLRLKIAGSRAVCTS